MAEANGVMQPTRSRVGLSPLRFTSGPSSPWLAAGDASTPASLGPHLPQPPMGLPPVARPAADVARPLVRAALRRGGQRCPLLDSDAARRQRLLAAAARSAAAAKEILERSRRRLADVQRGLAAVARPAAASNGGRKQGAGGAAAAAAAAAALPGDVYEALKAVPNLGRDDLLRGYSALVRDDRRFRALMALPMEMRKDWLLMEIGTD